jgi:hypothetical protein
MLICDVPNEFRPNYKSDYPSYTSGKNIEEICYDYLIKNKDNIKTHYIYLPVFWTSYYVTHNYGNNIDNLYTFLSKLDKNKKYFTIVQYASGIFVKNYNLNIVVFSAGGGGLNVNNHDTNRDVRFNGLKRTIFFGNKGNYDIPLICLPLFPCINVNKDIYCSFMGRLDTHKCRIDMKAELECNNNFRFLKSKDFNEYKNIINRSIFTLAPRGYGYTSFRIYEAIHGNSIPIYIWEDKKILPYSEIINWDDISVVINSKDIKEIPNILKKINVNEKLNNILKVKHMFTFDFMFDYIKKTMENCRI